MCVPIISLFPILIKLLSLGRMATSSESINATLRLIEFFTIPRAQGDCVVLLLAHPGVNSLGRYYPPTKVNDILLGDLSRRALTHGDMYMIEDTDMMEEVEACDILRLFSSTPPFANST
jgi:hypothetical protein